MIKPTAKQIADRICSQTYTQSPKHLGEIIESSLISYADQECKKRDNQIKKLLLVANIHIMLTTEHEDDLVSVNKVRIVIDDIIKIINTYGKDKELELELPGLTEKDLELIKYRKEANE